MIARKKKATGKKSKVVHTKAKILVAGFANPHKTKEKPRVEDKLLQAQKEIARLETELRSQRNQTIQKDKEWQDILSTKAADITRVENERAKGAQDNQRLQAQIQSLKLNQEELLTQIAQQDGEWQEKFNTESLRSQQIEDDKLKLQKLLQDTQTENEKLEKSLGIIKSDKNALEKRLDSESKDKNDYLAKNIALEEKINGGNLTIENLINQKQELETKLRDQKYLVLLEWGQGLGEVLTKLSALAEKEPEPVLGLTARAVYETLLDWLEKAFGQRPKMFPSIKECTTNPDGKYLLLLDADMEGLEALLRRYDWSPEHPFESKTEGQRQCQFKVMHWGWKVNETILVRSRITSWNSGQ